MVKESGKWIFGLRRIEDEPRPQFLPVPLISSCHLFQVEKRISFNIQLSTAELCEKKMSDETD